PPPELRMAAQRAESGARRIDEDAVERGAERETTCVGDGDPDRGPTEPDGLGADAARASRPHVERDHEATVGGAGRGVTGLAARSRARIEDVVPRRDPEELCHELRRLALEREAALAPRRERAEAPGTAGQDDRVPRPAPGLGFHPGRGQLLEDRLA